MSRSMSPQTTTEEAHEDAIRCLQVGKHSPVFCISLTKYTVVGLVRSKVIVQGYKTLGTHRTLDHSSNHLLDSRRTLQCISRTNGRSVIQLFNVPERYPFRQPCSTL